MLRVTDAEVHIPFRRGNISLAKMQGRYPFSFVLSVDNQSVRDQKLALMIRCTPPL
ncbi:DUF2195 family protein [Salmonella enterica subsp. enterica serovar Adjame]|nr:DUF2195 family protein [Salmonella enterica subsp. enterica serovar Adjame]